MCSAYKKDFSDERKRMLCSIRQIEFAMVELTLYLDNNPEDKEALKEYNSCAEDLRRLIDEYEEEYGPLSSFAGSTSKTPWQWVEEPWPWESGE